MGNGQMYKDDWTLFVTAAMIEDAKQKNTEWENFENELIYNNRFSSNSQILQELIDKKGKATKIIKASTILYRARRFTDTSFDKLVKYYMQECGCTEEEIKEVMDNWATPEKAMLFISELFCDNGSNNLDTSKQSPLVKAKQKWKRNVKFKGYGKINSSAPTTDKINCGRANPDHIRYLYLCEDQITPVYEIHPTIGQRVSIAKFKLLQDVTIYDLTMDIQDPIKNTECEWPSLYNTIGEMFSIPYNGDPTKYIPTQYITEYIKNMGFDGIRFNSSLHKGGVNIVLFNPDLCNAISSELVDIKDISITIDEPSFYKIGQKTNSKK